MPRQRSVASQLREALNRRSKLPPPEAVSVLLEIAEALDHAHRQDVVHRDVSPENIVLAEGHAVLTNMGVARALDAAAGARLTETGMLVGSPAYMSPEQAAGSACIDGRSDQYSLACVMYEMLVGEPLFSGPTPQAIMAKRAALRPRTIVALGGLSREVSRALRRALAPVPKDRFNTTAEFAASLSARSVAKPSRWLGWLRFQ